MLWSRGAAAAKGLAPVSLGRELRVTSLMRDHWHELEGQTEPLILGAGAGATGATFRRAALSERGDKAGGPAWFSMIYCGP